MSPRRRLGWLASLALVLLTGTASVAIAQAPADAPAAAPLSGDARAAAHAHAEGGYPDDIIVFDHEDEDAAGVGHGLDGAGRGATGRVGLHGDRDGGEPSRSFDFPMPDFVRQILEALASVLGVAARPIGYLLLAIGIAVVIALLVYLVVWMRLPKADLRAQLRRDAGSTSSPILDPLLEGSNVSAEEHAAHGRFREAIHALFLRALREATRAGDVDRRGRTAREVVRLVEGAHGAMPPLDALLSLTELVWFGGRSATEAQYVDARELAASVEARARALDARGLPLGAPA